MVLTLTLKILSKLSKPIGIHIPANYFVNFQWIEMKLGTHDVHGPKRRMGWSSGAVGSQGCCQQGVIQGFDLFDACFSTNLSTVTTFTISMACIL